MRLSAPKRHAMHGQSGPIGEAEAWWRARFAYLSQGCDSSVEKSDIDWLGAVNLCPIIARKLSKINVNHRQYIGENRQTLANQLLATHSQSPTAYPPLQAIEITQ